MNFLNEQHRTFYEENIARTKAERDPYRKALFYTVGLTDITRRYIHDLYDFEENGIDFTGLNKPWQTSTTMKVSRLAFNLYNGFNGIVGEDKIDSPSMYTPDNLFWDGLMPYFFEAIKIRYPEYSKEIILPHDKVFPIC